MENFLVKLSSSVLFRRALALLIVAFICLFLEPVFNLVLLTFIFSYFFYTVNTALYNRIKNHVPQFISERIVLIFVYIVFGVLVSLVLVKYIPIAISQLMIILEQVSSFDLKEMISPYVHSKQILDSLSNIDISSWLKESSTQTIEAVTTFGGLALNVFIAFLLSFFLLTGKSEMAHFMVGLRESKLGYVYDELAQFGRSFLNSFGKVMQMQIIIAFINAILSVICLFFMGFPQVWGLGLVIFFLGLIPVAGVIISLVPLTIIAFKIGGISKVIAVLVMIVVLHALESYVLNPRLMAMRTELPVFLVFAILIVAEHMLGLWGLLIGIPLFVFFLDILGVKSYKKGVDAA